MSTYPLLILLGELNNGLLDGGDPLVKRSKARFQGTGVQDDSSVVGGRKHAPQEKTKLEGLVYGDVVDEELQEL